MSPLCAHFHCCPPRYSSLCSWFQISYNQIIHNLWREPPYPYFHWKTHTHTHTVTSRAESQAMHCLFYLKSLLSPTEMAGHYKRGEVSPEDPAPQQYRIQRLLPPWAHSMGKSPLYMYRIGRLSLSAHGNGLYVSILCYSWLYLFFLAGDGVLSRLSLWSARRWVGVFSVFKNRVDPSTRDEL